MMRKIFPVLLKKNFSTGELNLKQNPSEANLTLSDLREMLPSHSHDSLISKLMCYAKSVSGTNAYWNHVKDDLKSIITQVQDLQQFPGLCRVLTFTGQNFRNSSTVTLRPQILNEEKLS